MKKRVLIFTTAYLPFVGGAEVAMKELTDRLRGYDFDMITARLRRDLPRHEKIGNVSVYRIGIGIPFFDKLILAFFGYRLGCFLHKKNSYHLLWSLMASYNGFTALDVKEKTGLPLLLTLQEGDPIEYILKRAKPFIGRFHGIFTSADGLQAISTYLLEWGKKMGFSGHAAQVIPNGVDIDRFIADIPEMHVTSTRRNFGFSEGSTILVTASRLVTKNAIADIISALPLLDDSVCFVVCGVGELEYTLRQQVKELCLESRVRFLGNKNHEELPIILKASDIFIRPSLSEGLGNSFLEAMAVGLPTIGTPVGGIVDFLHEGKTGFVCQPHNPASIAGAVKRILACNTSEKKVIQKNARELVMTTYNWDQITIEMDTMMQHLCT